MNLTLRYLVQLLEKHGFTLVRTEGSHRIYFNKISNITLVVPVHGKELKKGTFYAILKQANISI